jgi:hypothetical protein
MPLTLSHPAASIPFARLGLVLSALIIGSMTPDFTYFIPLFANSDFSHTFIGVFVYCLPVGIISLLIFHYLIKYPALALLPSNHQSRLYGIANGFSCWPLQKFGMIILSILTGAFTHILWDSFTHAEGWMVQRFTILKSPIITIGSHGLPTFEFLQYCSTLVGGALLIYWYAKWYKSTSPRPVQAGLAISTSTKLLIFLVMGSTALIAAIFSSFKIALEIQTSIFQRLHLLISHMFTVGASVFTLEFILFSTFWHFNSRKINIEL